MIIERLKSVQNCESTKANYLSVWRKFKKFIIKLDVKPQLWEDRASLFGAHLVDEGLQSSTLRSYISAIVHILTDDGYHWDDSRLLLSTLIHGCKVVNDQVRTRLPIQGGLLELILFEIGRLYQDQYYLEVMYKTILILCYYGLFRIGELTYSEHAVRARDVNISDFKDKMMFILRSSKTHGRYNRPQEIKISRSEHYGKGLKIMHFCPFELVQEYLTLQGDYINDEDIFFIFRDHRPVKSSNVRSILRKCIASLDLNPNLL